MSGKFEGKLTFSFAGCGFMSIYHLGVVSCLQKYVSHLDLNFAGASAGALAASSLLCGCDLGNVARDVLKLASDARNKFLGPFSPTFSVVKILTEGLDKNYPADAHERVNGKLSISVTRAYDRQNVLLKHFNSREELFQALLCSSFIPFFSGILPPKFRNVRYMDGGFTNNLVILDENTITVSPFGGESDICPRDSEASHFMHIVLANTSMEFSRANAYRLLHTMLPPNVKTLADMCQQGFDDTRVFLQRHNLIGCLPCVSSQPFLKGTLTNVLSCRDCEQQQQLVALDNLPVVVTAALQNAIRAANEQIISRIFQHQNAKLLSILSLPCVIPVDVAYFALLKVKDLLPKLGMTLADFCKAFALLLSSKKTGLDADTILQCKMTGVMVEDQDNGAVQKVKFEIGISEED